MPSLVTAGGQAIEFTYDPNHSRLTQVSALSTTTYLRDPVSGRTRRVSRRAAP